MHNGNGPVFCKNRIQPWPVQQITLFERSELNRVLPTGGQVVICDGNIAAGLQDFAGVRANVTRPTSNQNFFQFACRKLLRRGGDAYHLLKVLRKLVVQFFPCQTKRYGRLKETGLGTAVKPLSTEPVPKNIPPQ